MAAGILDAGLAVAAGKAAVAAAGIGAAAAVGIVVAAAADRAAVGAVGMGAVGMGAVAAAGIEVVAAEAEAAAVAVAVDWGLDFPKKTALLLPPHQLLQRKLPRAASGVGAEVGAEVVAEVEEVAGIAVAVGPVAVVGMVGAPVVAAEAAQVG